MSAARAQQGDEDRDAEIRAAMAAFGVDESEAAFIVAVGRGEVDGDVLSDPPLSPDERDRLGLGRRPIGPPARQTVRSPDAD